MATFNPISTYRIQFHKDFTFSDAKEIVPYLAKLGVSTLYASPIFEAAKGSLHGYDVINPQRINPEIGSLQEFKALAKLLKEHQISWIQDIVPNHMAFNTGNLWLMDLLEKGFHSKYAQFFDTGYSSNYFNGPIMVPFLGDKVENLISNKELTLSIRSSKLTLRYYEDHYPVNYKTYQDLLKGDKEDFGEELERLLPILEELEREKDSVRYRSIWANFQDLFAVAYKRAAFKVAVDKRLIDLNKTAALKKVLKYQNYELCFWQDTNYRINYRRFFTVNSLICLNVQLPDVFDAVHELPKQLIEEGLIQGLRIDHVDGLLDPAKYLTDLRRLVGSDTYIVIEKILEHEESLPKAWPIQGSSGYDYLGWSNNLFTEASAQKALTSFYEELVNDKKSASKQVAEKKELILFENMNGELDNLYRYLLNLKLLPTKILKSEKENLKTAIAQFWINFPVYRYYGNQFPLLKEEIQSLTKVIAEIVSQKPKLQNAYNLLTNLLFNKVKDKDERYGQKLLAFYQRLMQFSGPLMAKGVEDTLMYTYNRFVAHNEVGDHPAFFGVSVEDYHKWMKKRATQWPLSMNGTSTHDTKRGEDVRARLQVLSQLPKIWLEAVRQLSQLHTDSAVSENDKYLVYQTIIGAYPTVEEEVESFKNRLTAYFQKALREAKINSGWTEPDEGYEQAVSDFSLTIVDPQKASLKLLKPLIDQVRDYGMLNSLAQLLLKLTGAGVPDIYQGTELWDLSLVDPDNRRPVDYKKRSAMLENWQSDERLSKLWEDRVDGRIKIYLLQQLLQYRKAHADLFRNGLYVPLKVTGRYRKHIVAFARRYKNEWSISILPLHLGALCEDQHCTALSINWKDTSVHLPDDAPKEYASALSNGNQYAAAEILVREVFQDFPLALLYTAEERGERSAGILLAISSLPSPYGVGDFGGQARKFAQFLSSGKQQYWQLLPLNPSGRSEFYSPYSAISAMAGSVLYISPELLLAEGYLTKEDLIEKAIPSGNQVDFELAENIKQELSKKAYRNFLQLDHADGRVLEFEKFCDKEQGWLDDFAAYAVLKYKHDQQPWYKWPARFKNRHQKSIESFCKEEQDAIREVKWQQYTFFKQWADLKRYCNNLNIKLFGDLPFYVNYDSADVWSHPDLFAIDKKGKIKAIAGVPPDYFNANGQLWGMPVFNWEKLEETGYEWWIARIKKNMELFDTLRLDHFRAFFDYWEVPGKAETAKEGVWKEGPGSGIFEAFKQVLGDLPFIAEDLGDISDGVYRLRDEQGMPGMKVLQFAFGDDLPKSPHAPHNYTPHYIAYTGTHDNNTTVGWYRKDINEESRQRINEYTGSKTSEKNIHQVMSRLAYASVADMVILPMQDVLGLNEKSRMNQPATTGINWQWRLLKKQLDQKHAEWLKGLVLLYGR